MANDAPKALALADLTPEKLAEALKTCAQEPIQFLGAIQPHGYLAAFDAEWRAAYVSNNLLAHATRAGLDPSTPEGLFGEAAGEVLRAALPALGNRPAALTFQLTPGQDSCMGHLLAHRMGELCIVEQDVFDSPTAEGVTDMQDFLQMIAPPHFLADYCQHLAEWFQQRLGYDRVLIYRFEANWDGVVVAEAGVGILPSLAGNHFPASDIPEQARALYALNPIRMLVDVDAAPAVLVATRASVDGHPLDLSHCMLRAMSPVHLVYLRNMGAAASLSLSLLVHGRLWGMIACHHHEPRRLPGNQFAEAETFIRMASIKLEALVDAERLSVQDRARQAIQGLGRVFSDEPDRAAIIAWLQRDIFPVVGAGGCVLAARGQQFAAGVTPDAVAISALTQWLPRQLGQHKHFVTDHLAAIWPPGASLTDSAAGLLAFAPSDRQDVWLLWFRPEAARSIVWAGRPDKAIANDQGRLRLAPRGSFAAWIEQVSGRSAPWTDADVDAASTIGHALQATLVEYLLHEQEQKLRQVAESSDQLKSLFLTSVSHELRTPLNGILGLSSLALQKLDVLPREKLFDYLQNIEKSGQRLLLFIQELLDLAEFQSGKYELNFGVCDLERMLQGLMSEMEPQFAERALQLTLEIQTPDSILFGDAPLLRRLFRNLLGNALKFSRPDGAVKVRLHSMELDGPRGKLSGNAVEVLDSGPGIPDAQLETILQPFSHKIPRGDGDKGLGLAVARAIVELHGGALSAANRKDGPGACFTAFLPFSPAP